MFTNLTNLHMDDFKQIITESIELRNALLEDTELQNHLETAIDKIESCYKNGGKLLLCGNGGSAADAQHIAAELSGRFLKDRKALFAEALHVNSSFVTAVANDYGFDHVYERMIEAAGNQNDVLISISTSGNSANILNATKKANELGMYTVGMTGQTGGDLASTCAICLKVPSTDTARIQEVHITLGHIICQVIENRLFD